MSYILLIDDIILWMCRRCLYRTFSGWHYKGFQTKLRLGRLITELSRLTKKNITAESVGIEPITASERVFRVLGPVRYTTPVALSALYGCPEREP